MFLSRFCGSWPLAFAPLICLSYSASELSEHFRIWDVHSHLHSVPGNTPEERMTALIQFADRLGIERLLLSQGYSADLHPNPAQLREENDRCVRDGPMISVGELEADKRCNAPELDPIVEQAVSMKAPILQHTWLKVGGNEPGESTPYDLVELA